MPLAYGGASPSCPLIRVIGNIIGRCPWVKNKVETKMITRESLRAAWTVVLCRHFHRERLERAREEREMLEHLRRRETP